MLSTECRQVITMRMRDGLLAGLGYKSAQVPRVVEASAAVCTAMLKATPDSLRALRRILELYDVQLLVAGVFWGWVAQGSTSGWLQLSGGRPQTGRGKPLEEWRAQAVEAGGWGGMLAKGDSAWFATFRIKVRQQMLEMATDAVPRVTQAMAQQV